MNEWSDAAIANGIALMLRVFLGMLAFLAVAAVVKFFVERIDARRPRRDIRRIERHSRARRQMARDLQPRFPQVSALDHDALERRANRR
jgi:hypothetical protein